MPLSKFEDIIAPVVEWLNQLHWIDGEAGRAAGVKFCATMKNSYYGSALTGHEQTIQNLFAMVGMTGTRRELILDACRHIFKASGGGSLALTAAFEQITSQLPQQLGLPIEAGKPTAARRTFAAPSHHPFRPASTFMQLRAEQLEFTLEAA